MSMNLNQLMRFSNIQYHLTEKYGVKIMQLDTMIGDWVFLNILKTAQDEAKDVDLAAQEIFEVITKYQNRLKG